MLGAVVSVMLSGAGSITDGAFATVDALLLHMSVKHPDADIIHR